jgi:Arc/MetJ-type ribon-helix-helix transcriptional regulator
LTEKTQYVTVSIPVAISREIDRLIEGLGYWPSRSAFVRESCLEKIRQEQRLLLELKQLPERESQS